MGRLPLAAIFAYVQLVLQLVESGTLTVRRLRENAQALGATDAQLETLDAALTDAIARREEE